MEHSAHVEALSALAHPGRLGVFRLLMRRAPQPVRPSEISAALNIRPNTLSVYLAILTRAGLVTAEREGRAIHYRLDRRRIAGLISFLAEDCCRGRPEICLPVRVRDEVTADAGGAGRMREPFKVLFICSGNSARSLMAEAILNNGGSGSFRAWSAGVRPAAEPNRRALQVLSEAGHDTSRLRPKDVSEFMSPDASRFDFVFTLCDIAANEECPVWPGLPIAAHWAMPDPAQAEGSEAEKLQAFQEAYRLLAGRLRAFVALPFDSLDRLALQREVDAIGTATRADLEETA